MRKIIIRLLVLSIVMIAIFLIFFVTNKTSRPKDIPLFEMEEYQKINKDAIKEITTIRNTEGGQDRKDHYEKKEIEAIYQELKKIKVGAETTLSCDDNTTMYIITLNTDETIGIEIECNWLVLNEKRYLIEKE